MKEKHRIIAEKHSTLSIKNIKKRHLVRSDQAVARDIQKKMKKLCIKKFPDGHVFENVTKSKPDRPGEKQGSHSLAALHFFQNQHK